MTDYQSLTISQYDIASQIYNSTACPYAIPNERSQKVPDSVKNLRRKGASSTITLYAIRDLKGEEREEILSIKIPRRRRGSIRG